MATSLPQSQYEQLGGTVHDERGVGEVGAAPHEARELQRPEALEVAIAGKSGKSRSVLSVLGTTYPGEPGFSQRRGAEPATS
jgi:hypothetical protein